MKHHHHSFDIGTAILWGFGLAIGFALFHFVAVVAIGIGALIWAGTKNWSGGWRRFCRGLFIAGLVLAGLVVLMLIFAE